MNKRQRYHEVLEAWDGGEPTRELYDALGRVALGEMAGRMVGSMMFVPIGRRVFQLLEIAIEQGSTGGELPK